MNILELLKNEKVEWKKLGDIGKFYGGITGKTKQDFNDGNVKFITYKNIYLNPATDLNVEDKVKIKPEENQRKLMYGDILFTGSSETPDECGISSVITTKLTEDIYLNSFCFFLRLNDSDLLLPDFSKHLFRSETLRIKIGETASGVTRFNVSKDLMKKIEIPIPSIETQKKIVETLDKFTEYVTELQAELQDRTLQYNYYRDKLLSEGYLNKITKNVNILQNTNKELIFTTLGRIGEIQMCKRILKEQTSYIGDVPFYKIGTFGKDADSFISKKLFDDYKKKYNYPQKGEILLSASGTIGKCVIFDGQDAYFQDSNIVWLSHNEKVVLNEYLYYFYQVVDWNPSRGGTISRLYNYNLENMKIMLPSIDIQKEIIRILNKFQDILKDTEGLLPTEIEQRQKQYEYYREKLLTFGVESGTASQPASQPASHKLY